MKLPATVYSNLGPVPVTTVAQSAFKSEVHVGQWSERHRQIMVSDDLSPAAAMQVLCHEIIHVALTDSGASHVLESGVMEFICDGVGNYLAGAVRGGYLTLREPRKAK